ncbi:MAG: RNA 2',3'-cyclic phosphodiesterase [Deltaproteobacteria bacterium]|jgi:2'-5' RNA ligase|nr:RNA 2',3'-cyclic phosphodiesterase [Deltaproteobacteria bacterium]
MSFGRKQGALVRSFVALPLPEDVRVACAALAVELAGRPGGEGVRWARSEGYHVTLRFLGNVEAEQLSVLAHAVQRAAAATSPFDLSAGPPVTFPPGRKARVVALGLSPKEPLRQLAERVEAALVESGIPEESRRFQAHLTLGRIRNRRVPSLEAVGPPAESFWRVDEIVLYRSDLERDGARHTPLAQCPLGPELPEPAALHSP